MAVTRDIPRAYVKPRQVMAELLDQGERDDVAFIFLMVACLMVFVAQLPRLSRQAFETGEDFMLLMGGTLMAWVFVAPLLFYGLATISHLFAKVFKARGSFFTARMAMCWSLLAVSPLMLLHGLTAGFIGPGPALSLVGAVVLSAFIWIWVNSFYVAETHDI